MQFRMLTSYVIHSELCPVFIVCTNIRQCFLKRSGKKRTEKKEMVTYLHHYIRTTIRERERERFGRIGNSINKQVKAFEKNNLMVA